MNIKATLTQVISLNVLIWLAMLTLFAGLLACAAAAYLAMVQVLAPTFAALYTGLGLIGVFLLLVILLRRALAAQPKPPDAQPGLPRVDSTIEHNLRPVIGNRATDWTRDNTAMAIVGALAAGTIIAASPQVRHFVVRAIGPIFTRKIIRSVQEFTDN